MNCMKMGPPNKSCLKGNIDIYRGKFERWNIKKFLGYQIISDVLDQVAGVKEKINILIRNIRVLDFVICPEICNCLREDCRPSHSLCGYPI